MKFPRLLIIVFALAILSLNAQAQNSGPLLWTSYIDRLDNYLRNPYGAGGTFGRFTPGVAITVTRMQLQAVNGSSLLTTGPCHPVPKIRVTDGTTKYDLAIPNERGKGRYPYEVSADSGPISVPFTTSSKLSLLVIPGQTYCDAFEINVTVQYSVN
jgi:hypothetical protein